MPLKDTLQFRAGVPLAVRRARRVIAVSERTKRDLIELYGVAGGEGRGDPARRRSRVLAGQ